MKKLTILHSNDLHGDFLPTEKDGVSTGGLSRLSGFIHETRRKEKNTLYVNAGDMFRGSIIDSEYMGLSTIELMNRVNPDIVTVGNHEVDYGLGHLLFLEKCARFPIINANFVVTLNSTRLFEPYKILSVDGMEILFIGILTQEVLSSTRKERVIGTFIDVEEAAREVGVICDNYRTRRTDMVILVTHIGIEADRELAKLLHPEWGVDIIIGGHSHTDMEHAEYVNGVPIVQVGSGTGQIGRFDIRYDESIHRIMHMTWRRLPINENTAPQDEVMEALLGRYKSETDAKYLRVVTSFARKLTHPSRIEETELGNLYADLVQWESSFDIMMIGTGAIRKKEMGPLVTYQDMLENTPFDDQLWMVRVTGTQFRAMITYIFRDEAWTGHTEFYNYSRGVRITWRKSTHTLEKLEFCGREVADGDMLLIAMQNYHYINFDEFFSVPLAEVKKNMKPRIVATSVNNLVEEYFSTHQGMDSRVEGRIVVLD